MAAALGFMLDRRGRPSRVADGDFGKLLQRYGVDVSPLDQPRPIMDGDSKMKKWACDCHSARSTRELKCKCLQCGNIVRKVE